MNELETYRDEISEIDRQMAGLFEKRMQVCAKIGAFKKAAGLPVRDRKRENTLLTANSAYITDPAVAPHYVTFQKSVMDISCTYQESILSGL